MLEDLCDQFGLTRTTPLACAVGVWRDIRVAVRVDPASLTWFMETGALPHGVGSVHLERGFITRTTGQGDGKEAILARIDLPLRSLVQAFPSLVLRGGQEGWPEGWRGLVIQAVSSREESETVLVRMAEIRTALRLRD